MVLGVPVSIGLRSRSPVRSGPVCEFVGKEAELDHLLCSDGEGRGGRAVKAVADAEPHSRVYVNRKPENLHQMVETLPTQTSNSRRGLLILGCTREGV